MGVPVILVNATGGSDTAASGAGPGTALTGAAGISAADGLSVILDGSPDLSGVATDGTHVLYFADATAGNKNFVKITATANSGTPTATVTVANALGTTLTKAWAIGGKRASIGSTTSRKLFDNNSAAGDLKPGWAVELQSGHTETLASTLLQRQGGDVTTGPITLRGTAGAGTRPILTFSNNGICIQTVGAYQIFRDFEMQNTGGSTASVAFYSTNAGSTPITVDNIKIANSTNKFWKAFDTATGGGAKWTIRNCNVGFCAARGIDFSGNQQTRLYNNFVHDCGATAGIYSSGDNIGCMVWGNICYNNTGDGIYVNCTSAGIARGCDVFGNTCDSNTGDGIEIANANTALGGILVCNNICSNHAGGYGINFSGASAAMLTAEGVLCDCNNTYTNASGGYNPSNFGTNDPNANPTYTAASSGDFSVSTTLKAKGFPLAGSLLVGGTSSTSSYVDIGAAQRQEAGTGTAYVINQMVCRFEETIEYSGVN